MIYEGTFDVVIEGAGSERDAKVVAARDGLYVNEQEIPYETLLGVALRGSILLVVGTQMALALRGEREELAELAAELRRHADLSHLAADEREALEGEKVVFATPVALSGHVEMERVKGMPLAVVTDVALHVLERAGHRVRLPWERLTGVDVTQAKFGRLIKVTSGTTVLELLYLTDAQIQTIRGLAGRHASWLLASGSPTADIPAGGAREPEGAEAAPPPREAGIAEGAEAPQQPAPTPEADDPAHRFTVPEFELSLGGVGSGSDRPLDATIDRLQMAPVLPVGFLEEHLRELRTLYNGALLKRKREAAAAEDLLGAAKALDGGELWGAVQETVGVMLDAMLRALERQARRIAANRRIPWRRARKRYMPRDKKEIAGLRQRLRRGLGHLDSAAEEVSRTVGKVKVAGNDREKVRNAYRSWLNALRGLDEAYAEGWDGLSQEIVGIWQDFFMPRLTRLAHERRRWLPWPLRVTMYFVIIVIVAAGAYLYFTGGLEVVLPSL